MKRYLKYGFIIISVFAVIGLIFYMLKKPKESIILHIPADVSYCITIDKQQFFKEDFSETFQKDSFLQKIKARLPAKAINVFNTIGFNPLGDLAMFGETNNEINMAWIGNSRKEMEGMIKKRKWPETVFKNFVQVKISNNLFLLHKWPIVILRNKAPTENFEFFNPSIKKVSQKYLLHPKTEGSLIYGFIIPDRNFIFNYPFIPLEGIMYIGLKNEDKKIKILFVQPRMQLKGKLGIPKSDPDCNALISWPMDIHAVTGIKQIPSAVVTNLNTLITKPVSQLYAEVLDTISTFQEIIQYDMDDEFQLTQKIINHYKTYPGLRLEFIKTLSDSAGLKSGKAKPTNIGLDIFKLFYSENPKSYIIASEDVLPRLSLLKIPDYYIYADLDVLKTDPFWEPFTKTTYKKLQLHAEALDKGSMFVLTLEKN